MNETSTVRMKDVQLVPLTFLCPDHPEVTRGRYRTSSLTRLRGSFVL